ncbi:GHKL domain-containing protein [Flavihumibacter sp. R14]|nr:GHKL domain-containing protein [Flavihumibacter soli]
MKILKVFFLLLCLTLTRSAFGQQLIPITEVLNGDYIGNEVLVFQDSSASLSFDQVRSTPGYFKPNKLKVPNLGISQSTSWIKFKLFNNAVREEFALNLSNPIIDQVVLYILRGNGSVDSIYSDKFTPLSNRQFNHQFYLYRIGLKNGETVTCYLKLNSSQQILAPITINSAERTLALISSSDTQAGMYLGIMIVMLLYNLFVFLSVRDRDYLIYCHYIFWVALTQATLLGFSHRFLWGDNVWLSQHMMTFCGAMSGIATIRFAQVFLKTQKFAPRLNMALNITIIAYLVSICFLIADFRMIAYQMVNLIAVTGSLVVIGAAWTVYRKKYKPARYFLIGWSIFFASVIIFVVKDYNILPYNTLTIHAIEIGSALEAIFLSFALAGKINILKKEKEISQAEALTIAKENERIIREQNQILEARVNERTLELSASNAELNQTLVDLKEAESQLVEAEKMASLGQLTAGIAHEINNPINFVTSNVNPLKRDIDILLQTIDTFEEVSQSDSSAAEKQQQIDDFKEEIDFDYLKMEIGHLLKGIHEGASRTAEIVKGLRIFSRLDEDDLKQADINEGIDSTLVIVNNLLNNKIELQKNYGPIPVIECYPGKLNQVFLNIISNAIHAINKKFDGQNGGKLTISTENDEDNVYIKISDNGTGMTEATRKKVFEPFFTTKDVGEGTGLGMSIAYNTIRRHQGEITINTSPGIGTEFIIELPIIMEAIETN